jgi:hypothetical protein
MQSDEKYPSDDRLPLACAARRAPSSPDMKRLAGRLAAAWLMALMLANEGKAAEYLPGANHFGAVTTESRDGKNACASLQGQAATPAPGTAVSIVVLATPQRIVKGTVTAQASGGCTRYFQDSEADAFLDIRITEGSFAPHELGVLVLPGATLTAAGGQVAASLGGQQVRFFECSSSEGIHIGVRAASGKPRILWHDYLYLGIDVDPTCRKADDAAIDMLDRLFRGNAAGRVKDRPPRQSQHAHD